MSNRANAVVTVIARQFSRQAPESVKVNGRTFKRSARIPNVYSNDGGFVTFSYVARKNRREIIATAIKVTVTYDATSDLYNVTVILVDGESFDQTELANVDGVYADGLATVLEVAARK